MVKTNRYLSGALFALDQKEKSAAQSQQLLEKLRRHPVTGYAVFALVLMVMQMLSGLDLISPSFVTAVGSTIIFVIILSLSLASGISDIWLCTTIKLVAAVSNKNVNIGCIGVGVSLILPCPTLQIPFGIFLWSKAITYDTSVIKLSSLNDLFNIL